MAKKGLLAIEDILNEYSSDIQERITAEAKKIANNGAKTLKETSPKSNRNSSRKGKYAKGWRVKSVSGKGFVNCTSPVLQYWSSDCCMVVHYPICDA